MIYKYNDKYIILSEEIVNRINYHRQLKSTDHEAGGILLGKVFDDIVYIDSISEPSSQDESGPFFFYRNVERAQSIVENSWQESKGERIYLGEWHTHPEKKPTPSEDDQKLIVNMLKHTKMEIDFLIMIIAGTTNMFVGIQNNLGKLVKSSKLLPNESVKIDLYYKNESVWGFQIIGYVNYTQNGYDIYNAALSTISIGTINSILSLIPIEDYVLVSTRGFIKFLIPNALKKEHYENIELLLEAMLIQLELLKSELEKKTKISLIIGEKIFI